MRAGSTARRTATARSPSVSSRATGRGRRSAPGSSPCSARRPTTWAARWCAASGSPRQGAHRAVEPGRQRAPRGSAGRAGRRPRADMSGMTAGEVRLERSSTGENNQKEPPSGTDQGVQRPPALNIGPQEPPQPHLWRCPDDTCLGKPFVPQRTRRYRVVIAWGVRLRCVDIRHARRRRRPRRSMAPAPGGMARACRRAGPVASYALGFRTGLRRRGSGGVARPARRSQPTGRMVPRGLRGVVRTSGPTARAVERCRPV